VPLAGSLKDYTVPEILTDLLANKVSGVLELKHRDVEKKIFLRKGKPVYVDSYLRTETLSQYLIRSGKLSRKIVQRTLDELAATGLHHGELLLRKGLLTANELQDALIAHQEEKIENTFSWYYGSYCFHAEARWPSYISILPLRTYQILYSGIAKWFGHHVISVWTGLKEDTVLACQPDSVVDGYVPEPVFHLIDALQEPASLNELAQKLNWPIEDLVPFIYTSLLLGWIELCDFDVSVLTKQQKSSADAPPVENLGVDETFDQRVKQDHQRMHSQSFYDVLSVSTPVDETYTHNQFMELTARYPLRKINQLSDIEARCMAHEIRLWLEVAYDTLLHPKLRFVYDELGRNGGRDKCHKRRIVTEGRLLKALIDLNSGQINPAVQMLHHALGEDSEDATLAGYLGWVCVSF
jgi:hypothetical protein